MSVKDKALEYHLNGYNCAQSVMAACRDYYDIDEKTALAISAGFGGAGVFHSYVPFFSVSCARSA